MRYKDIAIQYNEKLTATARELFGPIVDKAYLTTYAFDYPKEEILERLEVEAAQQVKCTDSIPLDGGVEVWIKFTTGNVVAFQASEWGSVEKANVEDSRLFPEQKSVKNSAS
jgi:hypothetical protein